MTNFANKMKAILNSQVFIFSRAHAGAEKISFLALEYRSSYIS